MFSLPLLLPLLNDDDEAPLRRRRCLHCHHCRQGLGAPAGSRGAHGTGSSTLVAPAAVVPAHGPCRVRPAAAAEPADGLDEVATALPAAASDCVVDLGGGGGFGLSRIIFLCLVRQRR